MLNLIVSADVVRPVEARRHVANQQPVVSLRRGADFSNQPTVGVGLPAGDSGTTDLGSAGAAAQVASAVWGGDSA